MARAEMPIFVRTFEFLAWILPVSNHFPKAHRHTLTQRLLGAAFDLSEQLESADVNRGASRSHNLREADIALNKVRHYVRLAHRLGWLSHGQYEHVAAMIAEIGRLLGGWQKSHNNQRS